jgi:predicted O-methyltransferase YrrM
MSDKKFDPKKLQKLNNPRRLVDIPPEFIAGKLHTGKPDVMIEIGAGAGFFCIPFLERLKPSTVYACEISDAMIDWMKENVSSKYPDIMVVKSEEYVRRAAPRRHRGGGFHDLPAP